MGGLIFAAIASPLVIADPGNPAIHTYRSTRLGFSMDYPADWVKRIVSTCGGGWPAASEEERLRLPVFPTRFATAPDETSGAYLTVSVIRRFDGDLYDFLAERESQPRRAGSNNAPARLTSTEFKVASGEVGRRFVRRYETESFIDHPPYTRSQKGYIIDYVIVAGGRVFELIGDCPTKGFEASGEVFDAIAGSLRIFEPYSPANQAKPWETYRGPGFTFEFPGGWTVGMADDDAENQSRRAAGEFRVSGPRLYNDRWSGFAPSIYSSIYPTEPGLTATIADAEDEFVTKVQGRPEYDLAFSSYRNKDGVQCREVRIRYAFPNWNTRHMRVFLLQRDDGRVQTLSCKCFDDDVAIWEKLFDHVRYSFITNE